MKTVQETGTLVNTFSCESRGIQFVTIGQAVETRQRLKEIAFDKSFSRTLNATQLQPLNRFTLLLYKNVHCSVVACTLNLNLEFYSLRSH